MRARSRSAPLSQQPSRQANAPDGQLDRSLCPYCEASLPQQRLLFNSREVARQLETWKEHYSALARTDPELLRDSGELMHGYACDIWQCCNCGTCYRDPTQVISNVVATYEQDPYSDRLIEHLRARYAEDYRADSQFLLEGIRPPATVLEIGSHVGAFLSWAEHQGWQARGVDPNRDLGNYCQRIGLDVTIGTLSDIPLETDSLDGAFVLNCYEQLPDSCGCTQALFTALKPGGRLVLRTPNAMCIRLLNRLPRRLASSLGIRHNLWGMPFLKTLTPQAIEQSLKAQGYVEIKMSGRLLTSVAPARYLAPRRDILENLIWRLVDRLPGGPRSPWLDVTAKKGSSL